MPVYNTTQTFEFKVVDITVSEVGFICKVSVLGEPTQQFRFVTIPHGKYTSLLMLDFLLAEKRCSETLLHLIGAALKEDLQGQEIVLIDGQKEDSEGQNHEVLAGEKAAVGSLPLYSLTGETSVRQVALEQDGMLSKRVAAALANVEELGAAVKPLDDHKLRIVRDVPLSLRTFEKLLEVANETGGGRKDQSDAIADELLDSLRELQVKGILGGVETGHRNAEASAIAHHTLVAKQHKERLGGAYAVAVEAGRRLLHQMSPSEGLSALRPNYKLGTAVELSAGDRYALAKVDVEAVRILALRNTFADLSIAVGAQAAREYLRSALRAENFVLTKRDFKHLITDYGRTLGRLKARQHPTRLSKIVDAWRENEQAMFLHLLTEGKKGVARNTLLFNTVSGLRATANHAIKLALTDALRVNFAPLSFLYAEGAWRSTEALLSIDAAMHGSRDKQAPFNIVFGDTAWRVNTHGLYVQEASSGERIIDQETHEHLGEAATRAIEHGLASEILVVAKRQDATPLLLVRDLDGARQAVSELLLGKQLIGTPLHERDTRLTKTLMGQRDYVDALALTRPSLGSRAFAAGGAVTSLGFGSKATTKDAHIEREMLQALRAKLRRMFTTAEFIRAILFEKIYPAYIMDDMLFAEKEAEAYAVLLESLVAYLTQEDYGFITEPSFLGGVVQRISYLEDLGVLGAKQDSEGLLVINPPLGERKVSEGTVGQEVVGEAAEQGGIIETDNPLGWINWRPSENSEDNLLGQVPIREAGALLAGIAGEVLERGGHDLDTYRLIGAVPAREGSYPERTYLGEVPSREGSYPEQTHIGEVPAREGAAQHSTLEASVPDRQGSINTVVEGEKIPWGGVVPQGLEGRNEKVALLEKEVIGELLEDVAVIDTVEPTGVRAEDSAWVDEQHMAAVSTGDIAHIVAGYVLSRRPEDRDAFLDEIYRIYATPVKERVAAVIEDFEVATEGDPFVSFIDEVSVVGDYNNRNSIAFIDGAHEFADGLVYDYLNHVLEESSDVERWTSGFAIPEEYDAQDPLNVYHPRLIEVDTELLMRESWVQFDRNQVGTWQRNPQQLEFVSTGNQRGISGLYRNNFNYSDYVFWVEIQVDGANDAGVGVVFKYKDENNFHRFVIHGGDFGGTQGMLRPMQLFAIENGRQRMIGAPLSPRTWQRGKKHLVKVEVIGDRTRIWVDNRLQYDIS